MYAIYLASLVYATAEEAAKVPLRIMQANAQDIAHNLSNLEPSIADDLMLLLATNYALLDTIRSVLIHISTLLGEKNDAVVENCLNILEYLLR